MSAQYAARAAPCCALLGCAAPCWAALRPVAPAAPCCACWALSPGFQRLLGQPWESRYTALSPTVRPLPARPPPPPPARPLRSWTVPALAHEFRIRQQRVMAILALKDMEAAARAKGLQLEDELQVGACFWG